MKSKPKVKRADILIKRWGYIFKPAQLFEQLYKMHFKRQHAGKSSKKYLKLTQQIQKAESITSND